MTDVASKAPGRRGGDAPDDLERQLEQYRRELTGYCYRMTGSAFEAEDAVQETMVRAWRAYDRFEGRSSLRSWLYRIATNVCLDLLSGRQRRARPMDLGAEPVSNATLPGDTRPEAAWIEPIPTGLVVDDRGDPSDVAAARDSVRLAFIGAIQHLPPRQRAVLILREVLRWHADEVAELLGTTVASVNSALQRARANLDGVRVSEDDVPAALDADQEPLLAQYLDAFQRYDMDALTALLHADATQSMPPYEMWLRGRDDVLAWWVGPGNACRGSRLVRTTANGRPAFGQYKPDPAGGHSPWSLQVLDIRDGEIVDIIFFLDTERVFPLFGLPNHLD